MEAILFGFFGIENVNVGTKYRAVLTMIDWPTAKYRFYPQKIISRKKKIWAAFKRKKKN